MVSGAPIRAGDRVADVLSRDEALVDVFTSMAPAFERLRNPAMRRVMARLVTVEQAARIARVDLNVLLDRLNGLAAAPPLDDDGRDPPDDAVPATGGNPPPPESPVEPEGRPAALTAISPERVVEVDVREELRAGEEPFSRIMAARRELPEGGALKLRAIFEPVPLYAVMAKLGLEHWTEQLDTEDWVVWFYAQTSSAPTGGGGGCEGGEAEKREKAGGDGFGAGEDGDGVVVLDVRGLEPPEPMVRTLAALQSLPADATLVQINVREPRFLLPQLAERGFSYEVRKQSEDLVRVFIRHAEGA